MPVDSTQAAKRAVHTMEYVVDTCSAAPTAKSMSKPKFNPASQDVNMESFQGRYIINMHTIMSKTNSTNSMANL